MHHYGPYPATTVSLHTSVGPTAIKHFLRPVTYQNYPTELLPPALQEANPARHPEAGRRGVDAVGREGVTPN